MHVYSRGDRLGNNKIARISGLHFVPQLDVLDLHGNEIEVIENLGALRQLRVLNLAGNRITEVKHMHGLSSLSELNLRRNAIAAVSIDDLLQTLLSAEKGDYMQCDILHEHACTCMHARTHARKHAHTLARRKYALAHHTSCP